MKEKIPLPSEVHFWYLDAEEHFPTENSRQWCNENGWFPVFAIIVYLLIILMFSNPKPHKSSKKKKINPLLILWNLMLAIFSVICTIRLGEYIIFGYKSGDLVHNICLSKADSVSSTWGSLFIFSKFIELGDTMFMIASGKEVSFLHWYHHVTVLLYAWSGFVADASVIKYFAFMNSFVHSFMYTYFAAWAAGFRIPKWIAISITSSQIFQMAGGILVLWLSYIVNNRNENCLIPRNIIIAGFMIYGSYFILFVQFFIKSYVLCDTDKVYRKVNRLKVH